MSTPALVLFHLGPDPWIEERVQDINDDVHQRYGNGGVNHAAHNGRDVRDELFIDDVAPIPLMLNTFSVTAEPPSIPPN